MASSVYIGIQPPQVRSVHDLRLFTHLNIECTGLVRLTCNKHMIISACLRRAGKNPPPFESPNIPVTGLFAVMVIREVQGKEVPAKRPGPKIIAFSGPRGSAFGLSFNASYKSLAFIPAPPTYPCCNSSETSSSLISSLERSTL